MNLFARIRNRIEGMLIRPENGGQGPVSLRAARLATPSGSPSVTGQQAAERDRSDAEITDLVLAHLQTLARGRQLSIFGHPRTAPFFLVVAQFQPSSEEHFSPGMPIRRWRVTGSTITEIAVDEELPEARLVGSLYGHGGAHFAISEDGTHVEVGWVLGPRYGRGYDIHLTSGRGGSIQLGTKTMRWVS